MPRSRPAPQDPSETLQVVLDDATVARLRTAAAQQDVEVEQLIVHVLHLVSRRPEDFLRLVQVELS